MAAATHEAAEEFRAALLAMERLGQTAPVQARCWVCGYCGGAKPGEMMRCDGCGAPRVYKPYKTG